MPKVLYYAPKARDLPVDLETSPPGPEEESVVDRSETREPTAAGDRGYTVVKVYYGTDRARADVGEWLRARIVGWPRLAALLVVAGVLLVGLTWRRSRWPVARGAAWTVLAAGALCAALTLYGRLQPEPEGRDLEAIYGAQRGALELGTCEVSVPEYHEVGQLESPSVLRLEFREDPQRHVVLLGVHPEPAERFYAELRASVAQSRAKQALVFIHGYNVGFAEAARRTAQIAYDLKFDGAPIFYSWPSQGKLLSYAVDETNVVWTVPHLKEFLTSVARRSGATSVHLIAHSMGNRALTSALREMALEMRDDCPRFHQVVLTAPDIDAEVFRRDLAPAIVTKADRVTLYASSSDEALILSKKFHGYPRAGESGDQIVIVPQVDTIDVSGVDTSLVGHSYYGSNSTVLADLFELVHSSNPPERRKWLRAIELGALKYWQFLREQAREQLGATDEQL